MSSGQHLPFRLVGLVGLLSIGGCEGPNGPDPSDAIASVTVLPEEASLYIGATTQLEADVRNGRGEEVLATVSWSSSAPTIASVNSGGLVSGISEGASTVTASAGGKSADATIAVIDPSTSPTLFITNPLCDGTGCRVLQISAFIWEYTKHLPQSPFGAELVGEVVGPSACLSFPEGWEIVVRQLDSLGNPVRIDTITSSLGDPIYLNVLSEFSPYFFGRTETFTPNSSPGWNLTLTENANPPPPFSAQLTKVPICTPDQARRPLQ